MAKIILFADNDQRFLTGRKEFLEQEGYHVLPAINPAEAERILKTRRIDLAILDIRLIDDQDRMDQSGLDLAKETATTFPKIMLTTFPSHEMVREALGPGPHGFSAADDFVAKSEGQEVLLKTVRKTLKKHELKDGQRAVEHLESLGEIALQIKDMLNGPVLDNYRGYICVSITTESGIHISPNENRVISVKGGELYLLIVWLDPEHPSGHFETVNIHGGREAVDEVNFVVALDSESINFTLRRMSLTVRPDQSSEKLAFQFVAPELKKSALCPIWVQLFQKNNLKQVVQINIEVEAKGV